MSGVSISDLNVAYGEETVFKNFSADFEERKISVILGGSGVGKTTLLNAVAGLVDFGGEIEADGGGISYIFQNDRLIPSITVYKNLDLVLRAVYKDKNERRKLIDEMLELLEISDLKNKLPTMLSGGQAQRVAMARAYLYPSDILLLDEPFKALDTALKTRLLRHLILLNQMQNRTVIFVTHAIDECLLVADDYYVLAGNPVEIIHSGSIGSDKLNRRLDDVDLADIRNELLKIILDGRA